MDTIEQVIERLKAIKEEMNAEGADLTALSDETDELLARKKELEEEAANTLARKKMTQMIQKGIEPTKIEPQANDMLERTAFMNYVKTGAVDANLKRAASVNVAADLGVMIPETVQQEIIKEIDKLYGSIYSKVRKTNLKGGVKYPTGAFSATFNRITETTVSERQKGGSITGAVVFQYNIGEIRLAKTLLESILTVPAFEAELAKVIAEAYVKAMDNEIIRGDTSKGELEGITTKFGVKSIALTDADMADWKALQKKIFAVLPLAMRSKPYEFLMSAGTYESNIKTLSDSANRPVYSETFSPVDGALSCKFKGHDVTLVEQDILPDFDSASANDVFGVLWVPAEAYAVNTNAEFTVVRYFDHETNQEVTKALVVNDGKVLRTDLIYLLTKTAK